MTRGEIEFDILRIMGLLRTDNTTVDADASLRTYIQSKIQESVDQIFYEDRWSFRRKRFTGYVRAPVSLTLTVTLGAATGTVAAGVTPSISTWVGGHVYFATNGFPLTVISVASQTLTFAESVVAADGSYAATMYFDGIPFPSDCAGIENDSMTIDGGRQLIYASPDQMKYRQGYLNGVTGDYHFGTLAKQTMAKPDVGQPTHWSSWMRPRLSNEVVPIISLYPFPDAAYSLSWDGWRRATAIAIDGAATGDSGVPDLPTHLHRALLLPMVKLAMTDYPGFELSAQEKQTLQLLVSEGKRKMLLDQNDTPDDVQDNVPNTAFIGGWPCSNT